MVVIFLYNRPRYPLRVAEVCELSVGEGAAVVQEVNKLLGTDDCEGVRVQAIRSATRYGGMELWFLKAVACTATPPPN